MESYHLGLADGATDVHLVTLARLLLREYEPVDDLFPSRHNVKLKAHALQKYADAIEHVQASER